MTETILTDLRLGIEATVAVLSLGLLLWIAPNQPIAWMKKLMWISIVIALWALFVDSGLQTIAICLLSIFVYPMLTEATVVFLYQSLLMLITFKLFIWMFDIHTPHAHHNSPQKHK